MSDPLETDILHDHCNAYNTPAPEAIETWYQKCAKLERERDEARREAEIERDRYCHRDHGGHVYPWEDENE